MSLDAERFADAPDAGSAPPPDDPPAPAGPPAWRRPLLIGLALAGIGAAGALLVLVAALALAATTPEYGFRPNSDARGWALHPMALAPRAGCERCHAQRVALVAANAHATANCQGCHGPGTDHANARMARAVEMTIPTSAICVRCHTSSVGRPRTVAQITVSRHYTRACLDCHDPHSAVATRPPVVPHPLTRLPACIVCHGPDGFQARDQRHPLEPTDDVACMQCHSRGRGQIDVGPL